MPVDDQGLERSLRDLSEGLGGSLALVVQRMGEVVRAAKDVLQVDGVGVLLLDDHARLRAVAATGPTSVALEEAQESLGLGPGIDTLRSGRPVAVPDLPSVGAYLPLARELAGRQVRAVLSLPIEVSGAIIGNLNALEGEPHLWAPDEIAAGQAFADLVATLLRLGSILVQNEEARMTVSPE
jgi:GAF domain-containing protein